MAAPDLVTMLPVSSSNVAAIGYDPVDMTIYVRFKSGATYGYPGQPPGRFTAFKNAPSKGKFVYWVLRGGGRDDVSYFLV